jgi:hypothetical protein
MGVPEGMTIGGGGAGGAGSGVDAGAADCEAISGFVAPFDEFTSSGDGRSTFALGDELFVFATDAGLFLHPPRIKKRAAVKAWRPRTLVIKPPEADTILQASKLGTVRFVSQSFICQAAAKADSYQSAFLEKFTRKRQRWISTQAQFSIAHPLFGYRIPIDVQELASCLAGYAKLR